MHSIKTIGLLFQQGTFHRLHSPFEADGNLTAWSLTNDSQTESMVMVFQVLREASQPLQVLKLEGLKSECQYRVTQVLGEGAWGRHPYKRRRRT